MIVTISEMFFRFFSIIYILIYYHNWGRFYCSLFGLIDKVFTTTTTGPEGKNRGGDNQTGRWAFEAQGSKGSQTQWLIVLRQRRPPPLPKPEDPEGRRTSAC